MGYFREKRTPFQEQFNKSRFSNNKDSKIPKKKKELEGMIDSLEQKINEQDRALSAIERLSS